MTSYKEKDPERDEKELVLGLKRGEEDAYRVLVRQYQERLFRIAYRITLDREESLEIVQDVFLKVYTHIHTFKGDSTLYFWLKRITINQCLNWIRRWKRRFRWQHQPLGGEGREPHKEPGTDVNNPEAVYEKKELKKILTEGLRDLPEDARTVFILKELEGLSYDEIAALLKIKKGTVSSRLFYARQRLKRSLATTFMMEK